MSWSEWLMAIATLAWCQNMQTRSLLIYAICTMLTAIGKYIWENYL